GDESEVWASWTGCGLGYRNRLGADGSRARGAVPDDPGGDLLPVRDGVGYEHRRASHYAGVRLSDGARRGSGMEPRTLESALGIRDSGVTAAARRVQRKGVPDLHGIRE